MTENEGTISGAIVVKRGNVNHKELRVIPTDGVPLTLFDSSRRDIHHHFVHDGENRAGDEASILERDFDLKVDMRRITNERISGQDLKYFLLTGGAIRVVYPGGRSIDLESTGFIGPIWDGVTIAGNGNIIETTITSKSEKSLGISPVSVVSNVTLDMFTDTSGGKGEKEPLKLWLTGNSGVFLDVQGRRRPGFNKFFAMGLVWSPHVIDEQQFLNLSTNYGLQLPIVIPTLKNPEPVLVVDYATPQYGSGGVSFAGSTRIGAYEPIGSDYMDFIADADSRKHIQAGTVIFLLNVYDKQAKYQKKDGYILKNG